MHIVIRKLILLICVIATGLIYTHTRLWGTEEFKRTILSIQQEQQQQKQKSVELSRTLRENLITNFNRKAGRYVIAHNLTTRRSALSKKRRKQSKKMLPDTNYRLNRLLYQLWDPNTNENEHNMFTCQHLVSNDRSVYRQGKRFARRLNTKFYEYAKVTDILEAIGPTCNNLKKLFRYQNPNFGPASYSIAYTITLERRAEQSLRMLLSIYHHDNVYCLHPNAKFGMHYYTIFRKVSECIPNIILPDRIFEIRVKTHNRLKAEMECYKKLVKVSIPWKYGINIPSTAFPLYNNSYIVRYLRSKPYEVTINWQVPNDSHFLSRAKYVYVPKTIEGGERVLVRTSRKKKPPPENIRIFRKGSLFIGTRIFYEFLAESPLAKSFLEWTKDSKNPENFFYSSLYKHYQSNLQPKGGNSLDDRSAPMDVPRPKVRPDHELEDISADPESSLVISLWGSDKGYRCHGKYRGSVCVFGSADLRWLLQQGFLFANSFDFSIDRLIIDCLSKNLKEPILSSLS